MTDAKESIPLSTVSLGDFLEGDLTDPPPVERPNRSSSISPKKIMNREEVDIANISHLDMAKELLELCREFASHPEYYTLGGPDIVMVPQDTLSALVKLAQADVEWDEHWDRFPVSEEYDEEWSEKERLLFLNRKNAFLEATCMLKKEQ
jgi:hypothetical protein